MFRRLVLEEHTTACVIVAFVTAATIFLAFAWRALRMSRTQIERFANLPFETEPRRDPTSHSPDQSVR